MHVDWSCHRTGQTVDWRLHLSWKGDRNSLRTRHMRQQMGGCARMWDPTSQAYLSVTCYMTSLPFTQLQLSHASEGQARLTWLDLLLHDIITVHDPPMMPLSMDEWEVL